MAALSVLGAEDGSVSDDRIAHARARALAALRFSLRSHLSGDLECTDGTQWGHTWISGLGIERMMHGVYLLLPHMTDDDRAALRRVLTSEAGWLLDGYHRGAHGGVVGDPWNHTGKNVPESNLWNGAILWRTAAAYPDHPRADLWREQAHRFLVNAISVPADAQDARLVVGRSIRAWHAGANFFPHYALDHHGYLNVGYMVICLSNAAMLHYDMQALGQPAPASLYHHNADLWQVVRRLVFADGRLARIGGDSRLRYTYCQEYLLPSLVFASECLDERHAGALFDAQLAWIEGEAAYNGDGSFYGRRIAPLIEGSPYYYTRLESDRACVLGMAATYLRQSKTSCRSDCQSDPVGGIAGDEREDAPAVAPRKAFEVSVAGPWCEPAHGAALHRCPSRLASFAWRAHGLAQGMCQPPDDGHLAEWSYNLAGRIRFLGDDGLIAGGQTQHRALMGYHIDTFDGGFATCGAIAEGMEISLAEGWRGGDSARHQIAFVALPDGHTVVGLQHCRTRHRRTYVSEVKGLHLNVPNDLFNGFTRQLVTARGPVALRSPCDRDHVLDLGSPWAVVDGRVGVVGLYGEEQLVVHRSPGRRGGKYGSLYVDEICLGCALGTAAVDPSTVLLDVGWAVLSATGTERTRRFAQASAVLPLEGVGSGLRGVRVPSLDGVPYVVLANFGPHAQMLPISALYSGAQRGRDIASGQVFAHFQIAPCHVQVIVSEG
jgi:hypothetical protein